MEHSSERHKSDKKSHKSHSHKHTKESRHHHSKSERKSHKHHKKDDKKKDSKKDKKHHSRRHHDRDSPSSSNSRDSDYDRKDRHRQNDKRSNDSNIPLCSVVGDPITEDDYFAKNQEFRIWLRQYEHPSFEALNSKEAHHIFTDLFIPAFNAGRLPPYYYTGTFPDDMKQSALHTQHKWNIRLNPVEKDQVASVAENIDSIASLRHNK